MAAGVTSEGADILGAIVVLAMITVFIRPGSQGPTLVSSFLSGFSGLISSANSFGTTASGKAA